MKKECKVDGCMKHATTKGMCPKHYVRFMKWGDPNYSKHHPTVCNATDCTVRATRRGFCGTHYRRFMKWGDANYVKYKKVTGSLKDKVLAGIEIDKETGCWNWVRAKCSDGYGSINHHSEYWSSHRAAYNSFVGEIPKGMCVCHSCDNPACCNPEHLFIGTHKDNMVDMHNKGRAVVPHGEKNKMSTLTKKNAISIFVSQFLGIKTSKLAKKFNVSTTHIRRVQRKISWQCELNDIDVLYQL